MRTCDNCGSRLAPFFPRKRGSDGESLLCNTCKDRDDLVTTALAEMGSGAAWSLVSSLYKEALKGDAIAQVEAEYHDEEAQYVDSMALGNDMEKYVFKVKDRGGDKTQKLIIIVDVHPNVMEVDRTFIEDWGAAPNPLWDRITGQGSHHLAHDSGDGETIYHCPFCGAGGVMGRSDGTAECQFCGTSFTVQVQPKTPSMPQTVDGTPYHNPEMPGEETPPGEAVPGQENEGLPQETPIAGEDVPNPNPFTDGAPKAKPNPFAAILRPQFITRQGNKLSEEDYIKHLALAYADDREAVLEALREG